MNFSLFISIDDVFSLEDELDDELLLALLLSLFVFVSLSVFVLSDSASSLPVSSSETILGLVAISIFESLVNLLHFSCKITSKHIKIRLPMIMMTATKALDLVDSYNSLYKNLIFKSFL